MHSSGMRTARLLTISQYALHGGVSAQGWGVCPGGCLPRGVSTQGVSAHGRVCLGVYPNMQWGRHSHLRTDRHM